jgi:glutathione S-transferase
VVVQKLLPLAARQRADQCQLQQWCATAEKVVHYYHALVERDRASYARESDSLQPARHRGVAARARHKTATAAYSDSLAAAI